MLYHLAQPLTLLGVALALIIGVPLHNLGQVGAAALLSDPTPRRRGFATLSPRRHYSIWGIVAMLLVRYGWGFGEPVPMWERYWTRRTRIALALAVGPVIYAALCTGAVAGVRAAEDAGLSNAQDIASAAAVTLAGLCIVSLLPVPPLDLGRIILTLAPPTRGWQQARYQLEDRNLGLIIALVVVLLPELIPAVPSVVGELAGPLLRHLALALGLAFFPAPR